MPDRSKEELLQIYNDLLMFEESRKILNDLGILWPNPLNGKSWQEEKDAFFDKGLSVGSKLLQRVKSCEIKTLIEGDKNGIKKAKVKDGLWSNFGKGYNKASDYSIHKDYSLTDIVALMSKVINEKASNKEITIVNQVLDSIGTSACEPRAFVEIETNSHLAFSENILQNVQDKSKGKF